MSRAAGRFPVGGGRPRRRMRGGLPGLALLLLAGPAALPSAVSSAVPGEVAGELAGSSPPPEGPGASPILRDGFVHEGIEVRLELDPRRTGARSGEPLLAGDDVTIRFRITDTTTGEPMTGLYPAAWMDLLPEDWTRDSGECETKVKHFLGGSLLARPELDLNVFYVLTLNSDGTMTIVDPLFGFGGSRLLNMVFLKGEPADWAMTPDQERIFVSLPGSGDVAVVESATWDVVTYLEAGENPRRTAVQPDGRYVWVGTGSSPESGEGAGVTVLDARGLHRVGHVLTGAGPHDIAFREDSRFVFVTNEGAGTVSVIDAFSLEKVADITTGKGPVSVAYSSRAGAAYVVNRDDGTLVVLDGETHRIRSRLRAEPGLGPLRFAPGGRLGFVVNPEADVVHVLDATTNRIVQTGDFPGGPDQVAFTDELAYVRHRYSEIVLMIPLAEVGREGEPIPAFDFPGGARPFGEASRTVPSPAIVKAPGASAVLVANPGDRMIYYYKEGMAAPMGSFRNHDREPLAVEVVDRSLKERRPGVYETTVQLTRAGDYDLALFLDAPRLVHCFQLSVGGTARPGAGDLLAPVHVTAVMEDYRAMAGAEVNLRFRLSDPLTHEPMEDLEDVQILTFRTPGRLQQRHGASPAGDGVYEASFVPPEEGIYYVFLECASAGLEFKESRPVILEVAERSWGRIRGGRPVRPGSMGGS